MWRIALPPSCKATNLPATAPLAGFFNGTCAVEGAHQPRITFLTAGARAASAAGREAPTAGRRRRRRADFSAYLRRACARPAHSRGRAPFHGRSSTWQPIPCALPEGAYERCPATRQWGDHTSFRSMESKKQVPGSVHQPLRYILEVPKSQCIFAAHSPICNSNLKSSRLARDRLYRIGRPVLSASSKGQPCSLASLGGVLYQVLRSTTLDGR